VYYLDSSQNCIVLPVLPMPPILPLVRDDDGPSFLWYFNQARPTRVEARFETNETADSHTTYTGTSRSSNVV